MSSGGGGASEVGNTDGSGQGGDGLEVNIIGGTGNFYAGGGGGATLDVVPAVGSVGGQGGGGNGGSRNTPSQATNGTAYTGGGAGGGDFNANGMTGGSGIVILRTTKASATLGSGITVNSTAGPGSVNGVSIGGTSDYYYSATSGSGTITFS
jgi:hypothetical protein